MKNTLISLGIIIILLLSCEFVQGLSLADSYNNSEAIDYSVLSISVNIDNFFIEEEINGQKIFADGFGRLSNVGEPYLPSKIISIAIPPNAVFSNLEYKIKNIHKFDENYQIMPIDPPVIDNNSKTYLQLFQEYKQNFNTIFENNSFYPYENVEFIRCAKFREYNLVDVKVTPFSFNPVSEELEFYSQILINVKFSTNSGINDEKFFYNFKTEKIANDIIFNFEMIEDLYPKTNQINNESFDYVIITLESLTSAINSLVDWEIEKGRSVKVVTKEWIETNYSGIDLAQKIRNFLRDKYPSDKWGIQDLCIIGHWDDIPMRKTSQRLGNYEPAETDFYYAELSKPDKESWDSNCNGIFGEDNDQIDFYNEINVGRIPWSDFDTVQHICEKSVAFEKNNDPTFKNSILSLAAFIDHNTDGATFMEYCMNDTIHPWMSQWNKTRLYEWNSKYSYDFILNHGNVIDVWSGGKFALVSWNAHGSPFGSYVGQNAFIHVNDCPSLNDDYPAIISAASCSNSDTDHLNIGQAMMKQGAVGFVGANKPASYCSRWSHPNDGSDQSFKYFFVKAVTSCEFTQGQAFQYALREMYVNGLWYDQKYEYFCHGSLWGNPSLGISPITENLPPNKPGNLNGPNKGKIGTEYMFTTYTTDPEEDELYYCWSWGDGVTEWYGPYSSGEECQALHCWNEQKQYDIRVKARDINGGESEWSDLLELTMPKNKDSSKKLLQVKNLQNSGIIMLLACPTEFNEHETNFTFTCLGRGYEIRITSEGICYNTFCSAILEKEEFIGIANKVIVCGIKT